MNSMEIMNQALERLNAGILQHETLLNALVAAQTFGNTTQRQKDASYALTQEAHIHGLMCEAREEINRRLMREGGGYVPGIGLSEDTANLPRPGETWRAVPRRPEDFFGKPSSPDAHLGAVSDEPWQDRISLEEIPRLSPMAFAIEPTDEQSLVYLVEKRNPVDAGGSLEAYYDDGCA